MAAKPRFSTLISGNSYQFSFEHFKPNLYGNATVYVLYIVSITPTVYYLISRLIN